MTSNIDNNNDYCNFHDNSVNINNHKDNNIKTYHGLTTSISSINDNNNKTDTKK